MEIGNTHTTTDLDYLPVAYAYTLGVHVLFTDKCL